ncbi:hypothetical protein B7494_g784 [Chlorociboria aeruginascens]|nr:hypothetical protein B7494_g784 [Chlorociboria aeruginascens]
MSNKTTILVQNRSSTSPIKNLPSSIQIDSSTTVEDVKRMIAAAAGGKDPNRMGLFPPARGATLKDRKALIIEQREIMDAGAIAIKDLGMQSYHFLPSSHTDQISMSRSADILAHSFYHRICRPTLYPSFSGFPTTNPIFRHFES